MQKNVGGENYIKTLEDMTAWLKKKCKRLIQI